MSDMLDVPNIDVNVTPCASGQAAMRGILEPLGAGGNLVPDAHLAALAIEHGATTASSDRAFTRSPGIRWVDPLAR